MAATWLLVVLVPLLLISLPSSIADVASDQAECTNQLVGLAPCLPYVQGDAKTPTPDCCTGLKDVIHTSPKCLCELLKDHDSPKVGVQMNLTLALAMPDACNTPAKISECPKLLKLPANSPEAKIFTQKSAANSTAKESSGSAHKTSGARSTHHGVGGSGWWLRVERVGVLLLLLLVLLFV